MRFALILIALIATALFWPSYDLEVMENLATEEFEVVEENFLTQADCKAAALEGEYKRFRCIKHTMWSDMHEGNEDLRAGHMQEAEDI